jgi:hypothetical protein
MLASGSVLAQTNLIVNGGFETTIGPSSGQWDSSFPYVNVTGWASSGYNFVFAPNTADTIGAHNSEFGDSLTLWGPGNGVNNGLSNSPTGGNFVAADGAYQVGAITQTVNGLTVGHTYQLAFDWAGAQQSGFDGATTEQWQVSFGGDTQSTLILNNASHGFTGWQHQTFDFTATNTSELLSFLAVGTPPSQPPFSLLDGVSMFDTTPPPPPLLRPIHPSPEPWPWPPLPRQASEPPCCAAAERASNRLRLILPMHSRRTSCGCALLF